MAATGTKENKVWLVSPVTKRDDNGNITELGYPLSVSTSRRKARLSMAGLNTAENLPVDSTQKYAVTSQVLRGW